MNLEAGTIYIAIYMTLSRGHL